MKISTVIPSTPKDLRGGKNHVDPSDYLGMTIAFFDASQVWRTHMAAQENISISTQNWSGRLPIFTPGAALAAVGIYLSPAFSTWLQYDRSALACGQVWRIFTCHLTHFSASHLFWSGSAFVLLGSICESCNRARFLACLTIALIAIPVAILIFLPHIHIYRGLSGVDTALFVLAAFLLRDHREEPSILNWTIDLSICLFCGKIVFEMFSSRSIFVQADAQFVPLPFSHLIGAAAGAVAFGISSVQVIESTTPS